MCNLVDRIELSIYLCGLCTKTGSKIINRPNNTVGNACTKTLTLLQTISKSKYIDSF